MFFNNGTIAAATLAVAGLGNAHLIMKSPVPYGVDSLNNSPLVDTAIGSSTSDYPCKQRPGVYDITKMNHMAVGDPQELSFEGSASHGGGTCQIAVTRDQEPTANSTFKLIQVFEGGCPISSDGNGMTHPFTFVIPEDFPNGQATLAWAWYNRIGNREIYMNCAPITVTGGSDNEDYFNTLPNMYVINLPTSECESTQNFASNSVKIPHPGQFIMKDPVGQSIAIAQGSGCTAAASKQTEGVKGYKSNVINDNGAAYHAPGEAGAAPAPSQAPSAAPSSAPAGASSAAGGSSAAAGSSAPAPSSAAAGSQAPSSMITVSAAPSAAPSAPAPSSAAGGSSAPTLGTGAASPTGSSPDGESCSGSGMSCSSDGKQFGLCDNGKMVWQDMAPGTTCKNGAIEKTNERRNVHIRRHARGNWRHVAHN